MFFVAKVITSAIVIGAVTEIARRFPGVGGVIAALPIVSVLSLIWLSVQGESAVQMSQFAKGVLWGFPSTAVLLLIVSLGLKHSLPLVTSILLGVVGWGVLFTLQDLVLKRIF